MDTVPKCDCRSDLTRSQSQTESLFLSLNDLSGTLPPEIAGATSLGKPYAVCFSCPNRASPLT